ncbi:DUF4097 family beta strand repeat-containing protein [Microbacterium sp. G2-8]|uniref:DUF4097 family beta strand repeat-containing protein n=1 Tax=Microbacterium sp. G2-8 TaxID=2842454 RepID=UPI001C89CB8C|nr:DUF4097 family beta strand repeat-containing protein [Microbacterium sp. G2-8]
MTTATALTLDLDIAWGSVFVRVADRDDIAVDIQPSNPDRRGDREMASRTRIDRSASGVRVTSAAKWPFIGANGSVEVTVEVPEGTSVDLTGHGSIRAEGALGDVSYDGSASVVEIGEARDVAVRSSAGDVRIGRVRGSAQMRVSAGAVRVDAVDGDVRITSSAGDVAVTEVRGDASLEAGSGSLEVGRVRGRLTAKSGYGAIRVADISGPHARLETAYGGITVGVPAGTAVWLDARTKHGSVRSSLESSGAPEHDDPTLELHAHSSYGDIMIRYA